MTAERILNTNAHMTPCPDLVALEERVNGLERWQNQQNGTLHRIEDRINSLYGVMVAALVSALIAAGGTIMTLLSKGIHP